MKQQRLEWAAFGVLMHCMVLQKVFFVQQSATLVAPPIIQTTKICKCFEKLQKLNLTNDFLYNNNVSLLLEISVKRILFNNFVSIHNRFFSFFLFLCPHEVPIMLK